MKRASILTGFVVTGALLVGLATDRMPWQAAAPDDALRRLAEQKGFYIGTFVHPKSLRAGDPRYVETLAREFNMVTAPVYMVMTQARPGRYNFLIPDSVVAIAEAYGMQVRAHPLIYGSNVPDWLREGRFSPDSVRQLVRDRVATVMGRYRGRIAVWDVLNEGIFPEAPADADGVRLRRTFWYRTIGPHYVDSLYTWARRADPEARLFYNDARGEALGEKSDAVYHFLKTMKARGVPIDGVGVELHTEVDNPPDSLEVVANFRRLADLGLEIQITEMDISIGDSVGTPARLEAQARIYQSMLGACLAVEACTAFVMWGFTDRYYWHRPYYETTDAPLIFDREYRPKPAHEALQRVLRETER
jgi:endo-1,4-beta-xylanase